MVESSVFPCKEAQQAKLFVPQEYDPYQVETSPRLCYFKFDAASKALVLVADDTKEILDILDPDDIIGATVEVDLLGSIKPRVAKSRSLEKTHVVSSPIFPTLGDDNEEVVSVANNQDDNAPETETLSDTQAAATLNIFVYPRKDPSKESIVTSCLAKQKMAPVKEFKSKEEATKLLYRYPRHRSFALAPAEDLTHVSTLVAAIRKMARPSSTNQAERLLIIINPFSGRQKGKEIYKDIVAPMLDQAGIDHDSVLTTHARQAEELMVPKVTRVDGILDITKYDGLVAIGGDGSIHEILQGIKKRSDCFAVLKNLKLGHIGAGTSNGLSASLAHACQVC